MLKHFLRTLVILIVSGLVAGGIFMFANNGGMNILNSVGQAVGLSQGERHRDGFNRTGVPPQGDRAEFAQGRPPREGGPDGQTGFSLAGLSGVAVQAGKVALITVIVVVIQSTVSLIHRLRKPTPVAGT
jgi:hypothetical protein